MWDALRTARLDAFLREGNGLDTQLEQDAANLSGGQRQRLVLARAILADSDAYVFDEATSKIDATSEDHIMDAIRDLSHDHSVLVISHRLTNVVDARRIYVMDHGRVTYLFHGSIRDNPLIAKPDATQEELEEACRAASVHDFIMSLPKGYDTMVGELGDTLSGGERQRLGLARAFLHDAPFLLLDEPTSNLDALNEGAILAALDAQRGSRCVLLVSHRKSTMAIADKTYSMDSGRVS